MLVSNQPSGALQNIMLVDISFTWFKPVIIECLLASTHSFKFMDSRNVRIGHQRYYVSDSLLICSFLFRMVLNGASNISYIFEQIFKGLIYLKVW
jgi:hypothetical protein